MSKERRLGRGLEALLSRTPRTEPTPGSANAPVLSPPAASSPGDAGVSAPGPAGGTAEGLYGNLNPYQDAVATTPAGASTPPPVAATPSAATAPSVSGEPKAAPAAASPAAGPLRIPIRQIRSNPFQPRQDFDEAELQALADSLRAHGLLQPVVVRRTAEGYQLVAGERRLRAAVKAGWSEVPVQIVEADDRQLAELAIVENLQRKDLNALEKAISFHRYIEEYGCTHEELASRLKLDRSTVTNFLRLLELPPAVQEALRQGRISQGHARALLPLGDEHEQIEFCQRIQREGLSVRQTEALVQEAIAAADAEPLGLIGREAPPPRPRRLTSEHIASLEQEFRAALGTKVKITHSARGRGKLTIFFTSHEEFDRLRQQICGAGEGSLRVPSERATEPRQRSDLARHARAG